MLQNLAVDDVKELALLQKYLTKALLVALIYIIIQNVPLLLQNVEVTLFFCLICTCSSCPLNPLNPLRNGGISRSRREALAVALPLRPPSTMGFWSRVEVTHFFYHWFSTQILLDPQNHGTGPVEVELGSNVP
jgi:hypothetical protein